MCWWLFESFEKSIERARREHMDFIYNVDFVFSLIGFESRSLDEFADIIDSGIRCCIDLYDIEHGFIIESETVRTRMTRISFAHISTVDRLREDARTRRLSCSTRTMKEVGMTHAPTLDAISQYLRDVFLTDDRVPVFWSIFRIERHAPTI